MRLTTLVLVMLALVACEPGTDLEDADFARGGVKGKPVAVVLDSISLIPADTTVAPGEEVQFRVLYWVNGDEFPRIRCPDNLVYPYLEGVEPCPLEPTAT